MEQKTNKKKTLTKLYILAVLAILCLVYFLVPSVNAYVNQVASVLGSANVDTVVAFIRSYGAYAMAFSFALMVFQSAIAPLPAFLITFANAAIFGWWQGAILSWTSSMAGAALCFYLARALGRDTVEKYAGKGALASVEGYFEKYGSRTILICRLLPFVSFDAISYFAGLTPIKFWPFFIATGGPAARHHHLFLRGRDAHRRGQVFRHRPAVHFLLGHSGDDRAADLYGAPGKEKAGHGSRPAGSP